MWVEERRWHGDVVVLDDAVLMPRGATEAIKSLPIGAICALPTKGAFVSVVQGRHRAKCLKMDCSQVAVFRVWVWR